MLCWLNKKLLAAMYFGILNICLHCNFTSRVVKMVSTCWSSRLQIRDLYQCTRPPAMPGSRDPYSQSTHKMDDVQAFCDIQSYWKFGGPRGSHNCHEIHSWMVFVAYRVKWRALELGMTYAPTAMAAWRKKDQWRDRIVAVGISFTILVGCPTRFTW